MCFEGFKVQLWIAVNICQALLWHNLQVTDNDRRWKFTVSSVPWIQLWPIGPIRARWPCARPIAQCPFHFILEVNFFWVHSSWVSDIQWPAWWCEISSKSFLPWSKANIFLTCMAWTVLLYLPYAHYMWLCLFATKSCAVRLSMQEDGLQTSFFQLNSARCNISWTYVEHPLHTVTYGWLIMFHPRQLCHVLNSPMIRGAEEWSERDDVYLNVFDILIWAFPKNKGTPKWMVDGL